MLDNLLKNWKTTSAGIVTIIGSIVHLVFAIKGGVDSEGEWMTAITQILLGIGLMFAGDAGTSAKAHAESQQQIAELQQKVEKVPAAIQSGDTSQIQRIPTTPATPPVAIVNEKP